MLFPFPMFYKALHEKQHLWGAYTQKRVIHSPSINSMPGNFLLTPGETCTLILFPLSFNSCLLPWNASFLLLYWSPRWAKRQAILSNKPKNSYRDFTTLVFGMKLDWIKTHCWHLLVCQDFMSSESFMPSHRCFHCLLLPKITHQSLSSKVTPSKGLP